jgi:hypothetical protein
LYRSLYSHHERPEITSFSCCRVAALLPGRDMVSGRRFVLLAHPTQLVFEVASAIHSITTDAYPTASDAGCG